MWLKFAFACFLALFPSRVKISLYRWLFGYEIGRNVRIGLSPFVCVTRCGLGDNVRIGHFNLFYYVEKIEIGDHVEIGHFNLFRGGRLVRIGAYSILLRWNVLNSIPDAEVVNSTNPMLEVGVGTVVTSGHRLDFTDCIVIGAHTILGGRNSSLWTHNRQRTRPVAIGHHCYLGSEVRVAPGVEVPDYCIVSLGSVLMGSFKAERSLIIGNPASIRRPLKDDELFLILRKTRKDIPEKVATELLPADLREMIRLQGINGAGAPEAEDKHHRRYEVSDRQD